MKLSDIRPNPNNPRVIRDERFAKLKNSIEQFPKMMHLRPIVVDASGVILGGNMRLRALQDLGYKEIPDAWVKRADDLTEEEKQRFIIADNVGFGEWEWETLANEWDAGDLEAWGLDVPQWKEQKKEGWNPEKTESALEGDGISERVGYSLTSLWTGMDSKEDSETYDYYIPLPANEKNANNLNSNNSYSRTNTQEIERVIKTYMREGDYFLESCCGWSTFGAAAKFYGYSGIGVDIWEVAIQYSKNQIEKMPGAGVVEIIEADAMSLPFADSTFSFCYCNPPFLDEELYSGKENDLATKDINKYENNFYLLMKENFRVLKKDGLCVITINDKRVNTFLNPLQKIVLDSGLNAGFKLWDFVVAEVKSNRIRLRKKDYEKRRTVKSHEYVITFIKTVVKQ